MIGFSLLLALVALASCGSPPPARESPLDTAENHYRRGLVALRQQRLAAALREFERARLLDGDHPGAEVGFALVALARGEFWQARQHVERALHEDGDFVDAHLALGRIIAAEGQQLRRRQRDWYTEALRAFRRARRLDPDNAEVLWYGAQTHLAVGDLEAARGELSRIVAANRGAWVGRAMEEIERIQMVERAAPGSDLGKQIGMQAQITRAELAVLLIEELKLDELVRRRGMGGAAADSLPRAVDLDTSWARPWVEAVLALGVTGMELYPDGTFRPDEAVTRAQYAQVVQAVLILLSGDRSLATRYIGEASRFADVRADFYAYNAMALSAERGILSADKISGEFRPDGAVSGAEALVAIRELQNAFRMEF